MYFHLFLLIQRNHRMAGVGRDLRVHLVPTSCHGQGCQPLNQTLDQAAHGPSNLILCMLDGSFLGAAKFWNNSSNHRITKVEKKTTILSSPTIHISPVVLTSSFHWWELLVQREVFLDHVNSRILNTIPLADVFVLKVNKWINIALGYILFISPIKSSKCCIFKLMALVLKQWFLTPASNCTTNTTAVQQHSLLSKSRIRKSNMLNAYMLLLLQASCLCAVQIKGTFVRYFHLGRKFRYDLPVPHRDKM